MTMSSIYGQFTKFIEIGTMINFKWKGKHLKAAALLFLTERLKNLVHVNYILYVTTEMQTFTLDIKCVLMSRTDDIYFLIQGKGHSFADHFMGDQFILQYSICTCIDMGIKLHKSTSQHSTKPL